MTMQNAPEYMLATQAYVQSSPPAPQRAQPPAAGSTGEPLTAEQERISAENAATDRANAMLRLERIRKRWQKSLLGGMYNPNATTIVRPAPGTPEGADPGGGGSGAPGTVSRPVDPLPGTKKAARVTLGGGGPSSPITIGPN